MPTRRTGVLTALLLTAALFAAMPGLVRDALSRDTNRMHPSLRPPVTQTLTVWLLPEDAGDAQCIRKLCSTFEKQNRGVRIFLRKVTADELYGETAILPDAVLFVTGEITQDTLIPLAVEGLEDSSGTSGSVRYAAPVWYAPTVLSYPSQWGDDPWPMLTRADTLALPSGVALQQLMMTCPPSLLPEVVAAALGRASPSPSPAPPGDSLPRSRGRTPTPAPTAVHQAKVLTAAQHAQRGEGFSALTLSPAVSDRVRYIALCRDSDPARAFLHFLMQADIAEYGLEPAPASVLPNAFAHTRQEIAQLCLDGFTRMADPAQTLLMLR